MQRFLAFNKKSHFLANVLDFMPQKNAQHLQIGIHRIWTQHILIDRKQQ